MKKYIFLLVIFLSPSIAHAQYPIISFGYECNAIRNIEKNNGSFYAETKKHSGGIVTVSFNGKYNNKKTRIIYQCKKNMFRSVSYYIKTNSTKSALSLYNKLFNNIKKQYGKPFMHGSMAEDGTPLKHPENAAELEEVQNSGTVWRSGSMDINMYLEKHEIKAGAPFFVVISYASEFE